MLITNVHEAQQQACLGGGSPEHHGHDQQRVEESRGSPRWQHRRDNIAGAFIYGLWLLKISIVKIARSAYYRVCR